jgi:2-polyprenyl-3-methyl-5-hydroxy-6-metoxy-1,4-benzoquinol methylase
MQSRHDARAIARKAAARAATAGAVRLERLGTRLRGADAAGAPAGAPADGDVPAAVTAEAEEQATGYARWWQPTSEGDARNEILNNFDPEHFDATGRGEVGRLGPYVSPDSVVVDLGCGMGRIALYMAPLCRTLWAVDVSDQMLSYARRRMAGQENVRYARCADTTVPEIADASVDFLYSIITLQHLEREDAFNLVRDVRRMLRPGGRAFLTWPNLLDDGFLASFLAYADNGESTNPARARIYTTTELERLLPAAGFSSVEVRDEPNIVTLCTR